MAQKPEFKLEKHAYAPTLIIEIKSQSPENLLQVVKDWSTLIKSHSDEIINHHTINKRQIWFGLGYRDSDNLFSEEELFDKLSYSMPKAKEEVVNLVQSIIKLNTTLHDGFYTDEDLETGTYAIRWLVLNDLKCQTLYIEYLSSIDLDHTVEQLRTVQLLKEKYGLKKLKPLDDFAEEAESESLLNYLNDDGEE
jgi:hypothetical protein